jgi:hypothetical protein
VKWLGLRSNFAATAVLMRNTGVRREAYMVNDVDSTTKVMMK